MFMRCFGYDVEDYAVGVSFVDLAHGFDNDWFLYWHPSMIPNERFRGIMKDIFDNDRLMEEF